MRNWYATGGVEALRAAVVPGPSGERGLRALSIAAAIQSEAVENRTNWTIPRLRTEIERRGGPPISKSRLSILLRKKGGVRWRRPRHSLTGRQDAEAMDRIGLRLALRKAQATAGDITLFFADESEALTHPYLAHAWAKRGADLRVQAPDQAKKIAMMGGEASGGAQDAVTRELIVHTSRTKRSADVVALLETIDRRCAPRPGRAPQPLVLVLDNGPIHTSKLTTRALNERPWITVEWPPRFAPELNDIERAWRDLKRHHLAHRTFTDATQLEAAIHLSVLDMNRERMTIHSCDTL